MEHRVHGGPFSGFAGALLDVHRWAGQEVERLYKGPVTDGNTDTGTEQHGDPRDLLEFWLIFRCAQLDTANRAKRQPAHKEKATDTGQKVELTKVTGEPAQQTVNQCFTGIRVDRKGQTCGNDYEYRRPEDGGVDCHFIVVFSTIHS